MYKTAIRLFLVIGLMACGMENEEIDRTKSPDAAFYAARVALQNRNLHDYFDAITLNSVIDTLRNSIAICSNSSLKEIQKFGYNESTGCEQILHKYGWVKVQETDPRAFRDARDKALSKIENPRAMVAELEAHHREKGAGASFVWRYLDDIEIIQTKISGDTAISEAKKNGESRQLHYVRDETGWRFDSSNSY